MNEEKNTTQNPETQAEQTQTERTASVKVRKILSIALDVVLYAFLVFNVFLLIVTFSSKKNNGAVNFFGYEMRIVTSSSMEKSEYSVDVSQYKIKDLKLRSMVFIERIPEDEQKAKEWYAALKVGDVLTFRYTVGTSQETITHRIVEIVPTQTGFVIRLQGDNRAEGATVSTQTIYTSIQDCSNTNDFYFNYVIGKVVGNSTGLGYIVYGISQPIGLALIVIVPCVIIIVWQIMRVVAVFSQERKQQNAEKLAEAERRAAAESEERERKEHELEELRRQVSALQQQGAADKQSPQPNSEDTADSAKDVAAEEEATDTAVKEDDSGE